MATLRKQLTAARATVRELRRLGRLEPVDDAYTIRDYHRHTGRRLKAHGSPW